MYSADNGVDPGPVPEELSDLTFLEEQLIAKQHPIVVVFKVRNEQLKYRGRVINFPQAIDNIAKVLPHVVSALSSVITVRTGCDVNFVGFHVRADKVRRALQ